MEMKIALDAGDTARRFDENGFLHVAESHISKACISPYYGSEIPGAEGLGLEPDKIYYAFRDPEELKKSVDTWSGLPLLLDHHEESAETPAQDARVGSVGTVVKFRDPYLDAPLVIWNADAIKRIESGEFRELSCAYQYTPDFTAGEWQGQKYDFVMRNIRGNHVALVEQGRAGHDVLVADSVPKQKDFLMKLKKWLRGALDADPASVEQKEVDLAQAIIDLHQVDPVTGKIVDVPADADMEAVKKELSDIVAKLAEEDKAKLFTVLNGLAGQSAPVAADEDKPADAKDDDEGDNAKAFAEGVKYGEKLMRDPEERRKLDSEHESEGMKAAMDKCGLDSDDIEEAKAFAEGVKMAEKIAAGGEEKMQDCDTPAKDEDKNAKIDAIMAQLKLPEAEAKKLRDSLVDLAYSPATGDEDVKTETKDEDKPLCASDAALIRAAARADAVKHLRSVQQACMKVAPLVGALDPLAFDSAKDVYGRSLVELGVNPSRYAASAWEGMIDVMLFKRVSEQSAFAKMASDAMPDSGPFKHLKKIRLS